MCMFLFPSILRQIYRQTNLTVAMSHKRLFSCSVADELPRELMEDIVNAKPKNKQKKYAKMFPETWALLDRFYHSHNAALARILNDTKYHWNDTAPSANKFSYKQ